MICAIRALTRGLCLGLVLLAVPLAAAGREAVRPNAGAGPTEIEALIVVVDIDAVRDADNSYEASVYYRLSWTDPRLAVPRAERPPASEIWTPIVGIGNQQNSWTVVPSTIDISEDGRVVMHRHIWASLSQPLDLRRFPFDDQMFRVTLLTPTDPEHLRFVPDRETPSGVAASTSVPDWSFTGTTARGEALRLSEAKPPTAAFVLEITAERRPLYYIYTMILPLFVIAGMSLVAFWIEPENYVARLGVASTSMLTVVTYRVAMVQVLPRTAYFTDMDVFIFGATILVFAALIGVVLSMMLVRRGATHRARRSDLAVRILYPLAFVGLGAAAFA